MKLRDANLQANEKTFSHVLLLVFCLHFLTIHHHYFFRRGFERSTISLRIFKRKVVIYLFNYDSSKSTFFMLNMTFDAL